MVYLQKLARAVTTQRDAPAPVRIAALDATSEYLIMRLGKDGVSALPYLYEVAFFLTLPANNVREPKFRLRNIFKGIVAEIYNSDEEGEMSE